MKVFFTLLIISVFAFSAVDVSAISLDVTSIELIAVVMLGALAVIWVARRVVAFLDDRAIRRELQEWQNLNDDIKSGNLWK